MLLSLCCWRLLSFASTVYSNVTFQLSSGRSFSYILPVLVPARLIPRSSLLSASSGASASSSQVFSIVDRVEILDYLPTYCRWQ